MKDIIGVSFLFIYGIQLIILGLRQILIIYRFKKYNETKLKGTIKDIKRISYRRRYIPIIEFYKDGYIFRAQGYNLTSRQNIGDEVEIYYTPSKYSEVVCITNGISDWIGVLYIIVGVMLTPWLFRMIYKFSNDEVYYGIYFNKIIYFLPCLLVTLLVTIMLSVIIFRINFFAKYYGLYSEAIKPDNINNKFNFDKKNSYSTVFKSADILTKEERIELLSLLKNQKKAEAIEFYMKITKLNQEDAEKIIKKYTNYI